MKLSFLLRQWTMTGDNRYTASHSLYDSWQHRRQDDGRTQFTTVSLYCASAAVVQRQVKQKAILIFAYILYLKSEYRPSGGQGEDLYMATESVMPAS